MSGFIHTTGSISRVQNLDDSGFTYRRSAADDRVLAGVNFEGAPASVLRLRGLLLTQTEFAAADIGRS